ncbi:MAG: glycogen debranching protein GlgX, partial [Terriglobales bacterium]
NRSWNCGAEGATDDAAIQALRARQQRNLFATLLLSQGVPMVLAGDEIGRTQQGNNNAYCQDNEMSWLDWEHADAEMLGFCRSLIAFYRAHPIFHRRQWFQGHAIRGAADIAWLRPDGNEMTDADWSHGYAKALMAFLNGDAIPSRDALGQRLRDDSFLLLFNAHHDQLGFQLPTASYGQSWQRQIDTARVGGAALTEAVAAGATLELDARSLVVLRRVR